MLLERRRVERELFEKATYAETEARQEYRIMRGFRVIPAPPDSRWTLSEPLPRTSFGSVRPMRSSSDRGMRASAPREPFGSAVARNLSSRASNRQAIAHRGGMPVRLRQQTLASAGGRFSSASRRDRNMTAKGNALAHVAQLVVDFTPKPGRNRRISRFSVVKTASRRCSEDLIEP